VLLLGLCSLVQGLRLVGGRGVAQVVIGEDEVVVAEEVAVVVAEEAAVAAAVSAAVAEEICAAAAPAVE
jgi:hypothetical protein